MPCPSAFSAHYCRDRRTVISWKPNRHYQQRFRTVVVRQNVTNWKPFFPACCVRPLMRDSLLRRDVTPIRGLGPRRELAHEVLMGRLRVGPIDRVVGG